MQTLDRRTPVLDDSPELGRDEPIRVLCPETVFEQALVFQALNHILGLDGGGTRRLPVLLVGTEERAAEERWRAVRHAPRTLTPFTGIVNPYMSAWLELLPTVDAEGWWKGQFSFAPTADGRRYKQFLAALCERPDETDPRYALCALWSCEASPYSGSAQIHLVYPSTDLAFKGPLLYATR